MVRSASSVSNYLMCILHTIHVVYYKELKGGAMKWYGHGKRIQ